MLAYFDDKRAEFLEEIEQCEAELALARQKLEWLDELIADFKKEAEDNVLVATPNVTNGTVAMFK